MNDKIEIKFASVNDVPLILSLIKELAAYEKLTHEVVATEELLRTSLFSPTSHVKVIIGYLNDSPVGIAIYFKNYSTFLGRSGIYLEDLYVKPDYRHKGIGKKLLSYIALQAEAAQCGRREWSVLDWNEPAINFYKQLGARAMDEWTVYRVSGSSLSELAKLTKLPEDAS